MNPQLAGHETFYPRGNWLHKGLVAVQENPTLFSRAFPYPTDWLGVGVNMAKSIRHWLSVLSLIEPAEQGHIPTKFARMLLKCDPDLEHPTTLWVLQYKLVSQPTQATTWHWLFTKSGLVSFTREQFMARYLEFLHSASRRKIAARSVERDFQVLTRMYLPPEQRRGSSDDNFYPSAFAKLGMLSHSKLTARFTRNRNLPIPAAAFLYCLLDLRQRSFPDAAVLDLEKVAAAEGSPFGAFLLETGQFLELYQDLPAKIRKKIVLSSTAGMRTLQVGNISPRDVLEVAYSERRYVSLVG